MKIILFITAALSLYLPTTATMASEDHNAENQSNHNMLQTNAGNKDHMVDKNDGEKKQTTNTSKTHDQLTPTSNNGMHDTKPQERSDDLDTQENHINMNSQQHGMRNRH